MSTQQFDGSEAADNFDMLLNVSTPLKRSANILEKFSLLARSRPRRLFAATLALSGCALATASAVPGISAQSGAPAVPQSSTPAATDAQLAPPPAAQTPIPPRPVRPAGNIVVIDPAHGGTDPGARGTGGIRESEMVLGFAAQIRKALEAQGVQVLQTRDGNDNPSFDDRSTRANAQNGAIFVTLHISSTGIPGTVRVYVMNDMPVTSDTAGLIRWDRAQAPFLSLSRKLGDLVQKELARTFKGSPATAQVAAVRQLRTTAAPAIAVEISSVSVDDRAELDHMAPGVADAIAHGVSAFRPLYVPASPALAGSVAR
ncbi:MAG TPA: N-acetylmuramoyl-L-alanine amidase [Candidatus Dormibacteraeota bacterium]|nr:N-acetylmuramoyl-L-alanine amidase [Candidatus Dormibacteraeota bacterium]